MPLSWNEIRSRAIAFSQEWQDESNESAEAKSFWDAFFDVFGVPRRRVATLEHHVSKAGDKAGYIDLFWPGVLVAEHKSRGRNLDRAFDQAIDYFPGIPDHHLPRYVIVSDFARFRIHDLDTGEEYEVPLEDLHEHIQLFGFIAGYQPRKFKEQDPVNVKAADRLAKLHDGLLDFGYTGHELEIYLVRILFCLFAEDTGIFLPRGHFQDLVEQRTREDGADLGSFLAEMFEVLNTPHEERLKSRDEQLLALPFVNGELFEERLRTAAFDSKLRALLLECCDLDWGQISPAIFGSLFQGILEKDVRRNLGAHYTSEQNILKVIHSLFLDDLWAEFERVKNQRKKLEAFHEKLGQLQFLDPACGCGNFLVIGYRELRELELAVIRRLYGKKSGQQLQLDAIETYVKVDVDQFHGIEIEEWPVQIARTAMWLIDHQMNVAVSQEFGNAFVRIPLVKSANIAHDNALTLDWTEVIPAKECSYVLGNPPFGGKKEQSTEQKQAFSAVMGDLKGAGVLDFVAAWYVKALSYMKEGVQKAISTAFVSTNSICQGEQVGVLWGELLRRGVKIHFAHRTFRWRNEAKGVAAVHCVIIGFGLFDRSNKTIFAYEDVRGEPHEITAKNINPYLVDAPDVALTKRNAALCNDAPPIRYGSMPIDQGALILSSEEAEELRESYPAAKEFVRPYVGGQEFLKGSERWCLWLVDASPNLIRRIPPIRDRVEQNRQYRSKSGRAATKKLAKTPQLFGEIRQPKNDYLLIPKVSSENRPYLPIGMMKPSVIASGSCLLVPDATEYHFGILASHMHMAWMRYTGGRMKSDYQYSSQIVYNNFPWPEKVTKTKQERIEKAARQVLAARKKHPEATLSDLYDPLSMPKGLVKAHEQLDRAVDGAYGRRKFDSEADRVAFLFEKYQEAVEQGLKL